MFPKAGCDLWGIQISILKPPKKDSFLQLVADIEIFSKMVIMKFKLYKIKYGPPKKKKKKKHKHKHTHTNT